ncbi:hypothetical protein [Bacillus sp. 1NLA3E]|uniref:hypothetical protein n=1 Tax=Bacillus sp. 1NLA3E TaxID=666686 RepID=UPI000247E857|nr:hypothetical protein [Bacillus sp. 1NLA3E]
MTVLLGLVLLSYLVVGAASYRYLYKIKQIIGYHFGMNIAMTSSMIMGIGVGTILGYQFPAYYTWITIITTIIAIFLGSLFGALVDYQTLITGVFSGIMSGIMGPMIGVMADLGLIVFITILVFFTFGLLCFSVRS